MGDRSNIVVVQPDQSRIWLYGHWMGEDNYRVAGQVLSRKLRWNDSPYLTRMLFEYMIEGVYDKETGFGISTYMCDNEYPIVVIDPERQTVHLEEYIWGELPKGKTTKFDIITPAVSFEDFVNAYLVSESINDLAVNMGAKLVTQ
jgi:hypothetical protein